MNICVHVSDGLFQVIGLNVYVSESNSPTTVADMSLYWKMSFENLECH